MDELIRSHEDETSKLKEKLTHNENLIKIYEEELHHVRVGSSTSTNQQQNHPSSVDKSVSPKWNSPNVIVSKKWI